MLQPRLVAMVVMEPHLLYQAYLLLMPVAAVAEFITLRRIQMGRVAQAAAVRGTELQEPLIQAVGVELLIRRLVVLLTKAQQETAAQE
jgi:hypothetical protein